MTDNTTNYLEQLAEREFTRFVSKLTAKRIDRLKLEARSEYAAVALGLLAIDRDAPTDADYNRVAKVFSVGLDQLEAAYFESRGF